jgi:hypothetical protein
LGQPVPVTGKIIYQDQPVANARITFHNKATEGGRSATGRTGPDGTFSLTTFKTDDGALPGDYIITVSLVESGAADEISVENDDMGADYGAMMDAAASGDMVKARGENKLPEKYADVLESGIERSVSDTPPNDFEIVLE